MIHVLIVEDEPPTLRRIAGMVERLDPAFTVVSTALNGQAALSAMEQVPVDVVFTDIRMPVMDGLTLMDQIAERYPDCIVVVLSGYSDFEYVSHAVRSHSFDYLLKPVSNEEMQALLARIRETWTQRRREHLKRMLSINLNKSEPGEAEGDPAQCPMGICLFCAGALPAGDDAEMYPAASFWNERALEPIAQSIVPGYLDFTWEFMGNTPVERILIFQPESTAHVDWAQALHEALIEVDMPVSCAVGTELTSLGDANAQLRGLRRALRDRIEIGRSVFLPVGAQQADSAPRLRRDRELMRKWATALLSGHAHQGGALIEGLLERVERERWTQRELLGFFDGMLGLVDADENASVKALTEQYRTVLAEAVCTSLSLSELGGKLKTLMPTGETPAPGESIKQAKVVSEIARYLREHYAEHITNQTLSQVFGYVPSYISLLFRQQYQYSPSEYLTQIRMEKAKALIVEQPELLIREVAEQVGFKSQHHFSRIFKKNEGVWPTGYQS